MFEVYKITKYTGPRDGQDLLGLLVIKANHAYFIVDPEPNLEVPQVLSTALLNLRQPPIGSFRFPFKKHQWNLNFEHASTTEIRGTWNNSGTGPEPPAADDTWVATGSGIGVPPYGDEVRAASAK